MCVYKKHNQSNLYRALNQTFDSFILIVFVMSILSRCDRQNNVATKRDILLGDDFAIILIPTTSACRSGRGGGSSSGWFRRCFGLFLHHIFIRSAIQYDQVHAFFIQLPEATQTHRATHPVASPATPAVRQQVCANKVGVVVDVPQYLAYYI